MKEVEYRVRPVTRYVVTRWYSEGQVSGPWSGGSECLGEFDREDAAIKVMEGMAGIERTPIEFAPTPGDGKSIRWTEE